MTTILEFFRQNLIMNFIFLYWINLLVDWSFQTPFMGENKSKYNYVLYVHSAIWGLSMWIGLIALGLLHFIIFKLIFLIVGHILIDGWKCKEYYKKFNLSDIHALYIDQSLHVVQILICML